MTPTDLTLETSRVILRPLMVDDFEALHALAQDQDMWKYFTLNLAEPSSLRKWFEQAFVDKAANTRRPFTIIDKRTGQIAGSMSLMNISFHDLRAEIGSSWLGKDYRSSGVNKHSKYAMMRHAFEEWQFERIEFKTDVLNDRARQGLRNVGGVEEGILRSHMKMWNDRRRSSIYYSVLREEWFKLKETIFKDM